MNERHGRRTFLRGAVAAAAAVPFSTLFTRHAVASPFGPLRPDPKKIFDLPEGFSYRILERSMDPMDDGYRVPARPDGMGCFPGPGGTVVLMRNHENVPGKEKYGPWKPGQKPPPEAFDPRGMGGVTRVVLRGDSFTRVSSNLVLAGTNVNCAGGVSPWGWLSCEENVEPGHGYVFVCPTDADRVQPPRRVPGYGRFLHEAAAVDPDTLIAYLTEDRPDGSFYRFVPDRKEEPFVGKLQALRVVGRERLDTSAALRPGMVVAVDWVDIPDPDPKDDSVRAQAQARGAAIFRRSEGITRHGGAVYVCATKGGPLEAGQIFRYVPAAKGGGGTLEVVGESTDRRALDMPDNITFSPSGELFMAEDGPGEKRIVVMNARGETYLFGHNAMSLSELAGVCFSPDGRALFFNMQEDGMTLVVTGPFPGATAAPTLETTAPGAAGTKGPPAAGTPVSGGAALPSGETPSVLPEGVLEDAVASHSAENRNFAGCSGCATADNAESSGVTIAGAGALALLLRRVCSRG
ncbi:alkaline phosphatase PhoX [Chondromyces apiculatus]|uniref:DUF839 domain-containing protein n=1 Tax=Chondromyces apiculatus DSM 436 TaxID=1192034 RepID=A0A017TF33_9BACT|nr:alkaline phosphatase PhoX [Chondromyces apiculatus]EYF07854.1 Hypothetical protein CAP_6876 [Chondromyces apiculatus DSM 436]